MNWLHVLWFHYGWQSDLGNGPENIQWTFLALIVASLLIPRVRKFFKRHFESVHEKLEAHHQAVLHQAEHHHETLLAQNEEHHETALALAKQHHEEMMGKKTLKRDAKGRFL